MECLVKIDTFRRANVCMHVILDRELIMNAWSAASTCGQLVAGQLFPCPFLLSYFLMKSERFVLAKLCCAGHNQIIVEQ